MRQLVLQLLQKGPATRKQLVKKGKFSAASLDGHLKALRSEKTISATGKRPIIFSIIHAHDPNIVDADFEPVVVTTKSPGSSGALIPASVPAELQAALDAVNRRLGAKTRLQEKLVTLERLAANMPEPVAQILREIQDDYLRHAV